MSKKSILFDNNKKNQGDGKKSIRGEFALANMQTMCDNVPFHFLPGVCGGVFAFVLCAWQKSVVLQDSRAEEVELEGEGTV